MAGIGYLMVDGLSISHVDGKNWSPANSRLNEYSVKGIYETKNRKKTTVKSYDAQSRRKAIEFAKDDGLVRLIKCDLIKKQNA